MVLVMIPTSGVRLNKRKSSGLGTLVSSKAGSGEVLHAKTAGRTILLEPSRSIGRPLPRFLPARRHRGRKVRTSHEATAPATVGRPTRSSRACRREGNHLERHPVASLEQTGNVAGGSMLTKIRGEAPMRKHSRHASRRQLPRAGAHPDLRQAVRSQITAPAVRS